MYASEKSGYVATSFWRITSREGMKLTPTIAVMVYKEENHFFYKLALKQRRSPVNAQDESVLKLIQGVRVKNIWRQGNLKESRENSKDWTMSLYSEENYSTLPDLYKALEADLEHFIPQVDEIIRSIKAEHPEFEAARLTADDLAKELAEFEKKREARVKSKPLQVSKTDKMDFPVSLPLNQILYGPPGTGKTYATIEMAARIANPDFTDFGDREALHKEFRRLKDVRRIAFTTFHQSLSYEDFVEGLKPKLEEGTEEDVSYEIKTGIFREICTDAAYEIYQSGQNAGKKVELDYGDRFEAYIAHVQEILDNDQLVQLTTKAGRGAEITGITDRGNILIKHDNGERTYTISKDRQVRLDEGIPDFSNIEGNIYTVFRTIIGGSNASMHWAVMNAVLNFTPPVAEETQVIPSSKAKSKAIRGMGHEDYSSFDAPKYVLIIDEINRGNVSAILGELITLLEPDKRLGAREELKVTLPYSREEFGVPPNLYLIGTMNTADRSVEALDAALRRRFTFKEVAPNPQVIRDVHETQGIIPISGVEEPVDLAHLLALLNRRIKALKDADHLLGHSYFLRVKDWRGLASAFNNRIIPLLREYFFANYGQLQLVVGKGFCAVEATETTDFAEADEEVDDYAGDYKSYRFPAPATEADLSAALRQLGLS